MKTNWKQFRIKHVERGREREKEGGSGQETELGCGIQCGEGSFKFLPQRLIYVLLK